MEGLSEKVRSLMRLRDPVPVNEEKLREARERGRQAEELLRNEALQRAFVQLDEGYQNIWRHTSPDDHETRERAWSQLRQLDDLRNLLISTVRNGAAAHGELERALRR